MEVIVDLVEQYLKRLDYVVRVLREGVREDNGWWHVPVHASPEPTQRWRYYEDLTNIETAIEKDHDMHVLLVPAS